MAMKDGSRSPICYDPLDETLGTHLEQTDIPLDTDTSDKEPKYPTESESPSQGTAARSLYHNQCSSEPQRRKPFLIPEGAVVIDLDLWSGDKDDSTPSDPGPAIRVKEEPRESSVAECMVHTQLTSGTIDQLVTPEVTRTAQITSDGCFPAVSMSNDGESSNIQIKEEDDRELKFVWNKMPESVIDVSDDDVTEDVPEAMESVPLVAEIPNGKTIPGTNIRKVLLLKKKKDRVPLTPDQVAQFEAAQRRLAERATGRPIPGGVGGHTDSGNAPSVVNRLTPETHNEPVESDRDDGEAFRTLKKAYNAKVKKGTANMEDHVKFRRAEKADTVRLKRIQREEAQERLDEEHSAQAFYESGGGEGLFVPLNSPGVATNRNDAIDETELDCSGPEEADFQRQRRLNAASSSNKRRKLSLPKSAKNIIPAKDAEASRREGLTLHLEKVKKKAARKPRTQKPTATAAKGAKKSQFQTGQDADRVVKTKKKKKKEKTKRYQGPELLNVNTLLGSDVVASVQANVSKADQPTSKQSRKDYALRELLASIPEEHQRIHSVDAKALHNATRKFNGSGTMRADGKKGWKLKGMSSSLYHYQLLGAAFLRERENGQDKPLGGILADEMGFGKTIMSIASMIDGQPTGNDRLRTTLIVAPADLGRQWMREIKAHAEEGVLEDVLKYSAGSRIESNDDVKALQKYDVIVTTYGEVMRSYPKCEPPIELTTEEQVSAWWDRFLEKHKGPLHRVMFRRIILDEAQLIKNHKSRTSIACRALMGRYRWALSGTPIMNNVDEFYSALSFLKHPHIGTYELFRQNFCIKGSQLCMDRLHTILKSVMVRRTHMSEIFGAPIVKLPPSEQQTTRLDFNDVERHVYHVVKTRFVERINRFSSNGTLPKQYKHIFTMMLRLRQLTGHMFLIQETLEDLLEKEDIEKLMQLSQTSSADGANKSSLIQLRRVLGMSKNGNPLEGRNLATDAADHGVATPESPADRESVIETGGDFGTISVSFKKYLCSLHNSSKWEELNNRSTCHACGQPPDDPWLTDCQHIYCAECLSAMQHEAAKRNEDSAKCRECGHTFSEAGPCEGLAELELIGNSPGSQNGPLNRRRGSKNPEDPLSWLDLGGHLLPSTKTLAIKALLLNWTTEAPTDKIVIFTQFHMMIRILGRLCDDEGWGYCLYHGKMDHTARDKALSSFEKDEDKTILIASLKCGGLGLNLQMANRVINVDLWFNSAVESQAICRVLRIGQEKHTHIRRFTIKNTIDDDLVLMQERKEKVIRHALDDDEKAPERLSVEELMRLFGEVREDENGKPFIWPHDGPGEDLVTSSEDGNNDEDLNP